MEGGVVVAINRGKNRTLVSQCFGIFRLCLTSTIYLCVGFCLIFYPWISGVSCIAWYPIPITPSKYKFVMSLNSLCLGLSQADNSTKSRLIEVKFSFLCFNDSLTISNLIWFNCDWLSLIYFIYFGCIFPDRMKPWSVTRRFYDLKSFIMSWM